ncbi:lipoprotein-releasing ABC transporter permease subunit LolE [Photobacterium iliopiscarium]|jgi:lipoprotein-releasing system permease protein|uniref:Lipoprotein-releasing ABC transporter permease subunit LolE n=1 Tax=Photobacterium iliopiscarium TaxID=56192 RepID=A0A2T3MK56_9GAMM|nr:lipoprotein-releasing ABC transporter permease subunit LolE [Photobacterium iliopiscarium]KJG14712.1 outer membrane-specific lipoprotein transporter subunit LolE [Photobacterium iliopiscarium]MCD9466736.1 lipoprotein-releasing system transmembrane subunit LolE [Photobacterium iliopiscarium]MCD9486479.1 lipoprotein-releasing ABC transporter permease subunit LolE [Photobacterium iliopiscarium]MCF2245415.1 lipoprotein-releasing ABC transporter permease subunit LolE [Photobacterium iliopiscarium
MFRPLSLYIGSRFNRSKKRNRMVSFISLSSMLGIAVGVAVIIIGLSAMNGFERELQTRVLSVIPQGELQAVQPPLNNWKPLLKQVELHPHITAAAPYVEFTALLERGAKLKAVAVRGVDPKEQLKVSELPLYVKDNAWSRFSAGKREVILGQGVATKLNIKVGDWITAMIPNTDPQMKLRAPKRIRLQVVGLLALGGQIDHSLAIVPLQDAQQYLDMGQGVSGIEMNVDNVLDAQQIVKEVGDTLPVYVYLKSWTQKYGYLYRDIQMVRTIMYLVMVLVIGVACFNIVSTLMMAVKDRAADIAILRTMGASDRLIKSIFVWHGVLSGVLGSIIGSLFGSLIAVNLTHIVRVIEKIIGHRFLSGDIYFVDFLPTQLAWQDVVIVTTTAIVLSLIATWYPATRASRLQPARVLSAK